MPKQACQALEYQNRQFNGWSKEGKPLAQCTLNDRVSRLYTVQLYKFFSRFKNPSVDVAAIDQRDARPYHAMRPTNHGKFS